MRVSVVVPAFNHAHYIGDALRSVLAQDVEGVEIIVVDDGSTDGTATIAEQLLAQHSRPYRVIRGPHRGAPATLNAALALARAEYVSFLNSDDRYVPGRLALLLEQAHQHERRFLITRVRQIDGAGNPLPLDAPHVEYYERSLNARALFPTSGFELLRHNYTITTGNFFLHRSLVEEVGPFGDHTLCHDWDYALRALLVEEILPVDAVLYEYRVHSRNTLRPSLEELRYAEIDELVSAYLRRAESSSNPLAPSFKNWGGYWHYFARRELTHLAHLPRIARALDDIARSSPARSVFALGAVNEALLIEALARTTQRIHSLEADLAASLRRNDPVRRARDDIFAKARSALKGVKTRLGRTRLLRRLRSKQVSPP